MLNPAWNPRHWGFIIDGVSVCVCVCLCVCVHRRGPQNDEIRITRTQTLGVGPFTHSALNAKVLNSSQSQVNGWSNYDSLKVAKCLVN